MAGSNRGEVGLQGATEVRQGVQGANLTPIDANTGSSGPRAMARANMEGSDNLASTANRIGNKIIDANALIDKMVIDREAALEEDRRKHEDVSLASKIRQDAMNVSTKLYEDELSRNGADAKGSSERVAQTFESLNKAVSGSRFHNPDYYNSTSEFLTQTQNSVLLRTQSHEKEQIREANKSSFLNYANSIKENAKKDPDNLEFYKQHMLGYVEDMKKDNILDPSWMSEVVRKESEDMDKTAFVAKYSSQMADKNFNGVRETIESWKGSLSADTLGAAEMHLRTAVDQEARQKLADARHAESMMKQQAQIEYGMASETLRRIEAKSVAGMPIDKKELQDATQKAIASGRVLSPKAIQHVTNVVNDISGNMDMASIVEQLVNTAGVHEAPALIATAMQTAETPQQQHLLKGAYDQAMHRLSVANSDPGLNTFESKYNGLVSQGVKPQQAMVLATEQSSIIQDRDGTTRNSLSIVNGDGGGPLPKRTVKEIMTKLHGSQSDSEETLAYIKSLSSNTAAKILTQGGMHPVAGTLLLNVSQVDEKGAAVLARTLSMSTKDEESLGIVNGILDQKGTYDAKSNNAKTLRSEGFLKSRDSAAVKAFDIQDGGLGTDNVARQAMIKTWATAYMVGKAEGDETKYTKLLDDNVKTIHGMTYTPRDINPQVVDTVLANKSYKREALFDVAGIVDPKANPEGFASSLLAENAKGNDARTFVGILQLKQDRPGYVSVSYTSDGKTVVKDKVMSIEDYTSKFTSRGVQLGKDLQSDGRLRNEYGNVTVQMPSGDGRGMVSIGTQRQMSKVSSRFNAYNRRIIENQPSILDGNEAW